MKSLLLLLPIWFLFCSPMPPPDTHRDCCYDLQRLRESDARVHVIAEELIVKNRMLEYELAQCQMTK